MNRKKLIVGIAGGVTALSLIGAGVGATYTDSASAAQEASTGTINIGAFTSDAPGVIGKSVSFTPADNLGSAGLTKSASIGVVEVGSLPAKFVSITVSHTGPLTVGVSSGFFNGGAPMADGTYPGVLPLTLPANEGGNGSFNVTYTVAPDSPQGESGTVTITVNGTA
jgi:hypothetical protein